MLFLFFFFLSHITLCSLFFFFLMIRRPPRSTLFPYRRSSDLSAGHRGLHGHDANRARRGSLTWLLLFSRSRSEEHTSELQSRENLVCRLLLEKKKKKSKKN